jgi:hypothetical protein
MQATALGRYLLYGADRSMPAATSPALVTSTATPGALADWVVRPATGQIFTLIALAGGPGLDVGPGGRLVTAAAAAGAGEQGRKA